MLALGFRPVRPSPLLGKETGTLRAHNRHARRDALSGHRHLVSELAAAPLRVMNDWEGPRLHRSSPLQT